MLSLVLWLKNSPSFKHSKSLVCKSILSESLFSSGYLTILIKDKNKTWFKYNCTKVYPLRTAPVDNWVAKIFE